MSSDIVKRSTVEAMVSNYETATREMKAAYRLLERAENRCGGVILQDASWWSDANQAEEWSLRMMKQHTWRKIVASLNIKGMMGIEDAKKLDAQLYQKQTRILADDKILPLPEISTDNILQVIHGMIKSLPEMQAKAIKEAWDFVRWSSEGYKSTDQCFSIGHKAVLTYSVERFSQSYHLTYNKEQNFMLLENAFRLLDGKGPVQTHRPEIVGALANAGADGTGETEWMKFKAYKNGNLHVWFKRMDLVSEFNRIASGGVFQLRKAV